MRWRRSEPEQPDEQEQVRQPQAAQVLHGPRPVDPLDHLHRHGKTERELAVEAVERELHLPVGHHPLAEMARAAAEPAAEEARPEEKDVRPGRWRWARRGAFMLVVAGGFAGALWAAWRFVDGPAQGTTKTLAAAEASVAPKSPTPGVNALGALYVTFDYPGAFDQLSRLTSGARDLEDYMLSTETSVTSPRISMAVEVLTLPSQNLDDDPSYRLRKLKSADYTASAVKLTGEPAVLMKRASPYEQTLFWAHGGRELTVSITSNGSQEEAIDAAMKMVLATARWR